MYILRYSKRRCLGIKLKVRKVGNSLTLTIPKDLAEKLNIKPQSFVEVSLEGERIIVKKAKSRWDELLEEAKKRAKELNISEEDVERAISEIRHD